jgi:hypothetical protein
MVAQSEKMAELLQTRFQRPLSTLTAVVAGLMIVYSLYKRVAGNLYLEQLNFVDSTTVTMVGVLLLRGLVRLQHDSDGQATSIALIGALSFVFCFEALYKLSFYTFPWRMPPAELREFIIQVGIALTALAGFAFDRFRFSPASQVFAIVFALGWATWLVVGFPQLDNGKDFYAPLVNVSLTWPMIYVLNRMTKIALCMVYYYIYV